MAAVKDPSAARAAIEALAKLLADGDADAEVESERLARVLGNGRGRARLGRGGLGRQVRFRRGPDGVERIARRTRRRDLRWPIRSLLAESS
jgi:hypothetical protein